MVRRGGSNETLMQQSRAGPAMGPGNTGTTAASVGGWAGQVQQLSGGGQRVGPGKEQQSGQEARVTRQKKEDK